MMKDLTEGNPQSLLWRFTIPMFISVIFQQLYNIADSVIAGRFAGEDALAAVGASYPITMIFMAIAVGSNIGWKKVISAIRELGAERVSFGSDLPFSDMHADLEAYKAFLSDYFTQKEKEFVLGKNIERVFRL